MESSYHSKAGEAVHTLSRFKAVPRETPEYHVKAQEALAVLRPYQKDVLKSMFEAKRWLNYMDMGMGKSLVTLLAVVAREAFPCLILCNKAAMGVMQNELEKWFDLESVIYSGKPKDRDAAWTKYIESNGEIKFIIANYAMGSELAERFNIKRAIDKPKLKPNGMLTPKAKKPTHLVRAPKALVCDEIHTAGLFNHKGVTYKVVKELAATTELCYLLTGTPYRKGVVDFFGPLSIIEPQNFDSYWKYVGRHCITIDTGYGKSIERNPRNAEQFRDLLRKRATVLKKADHLKDLPEKIRGVVPVFMDAEQKKIYDELTAELIAVTDSGDVLITPSHLSLMIRQRQLLICPQELGLNTRGDGINTMVEMLKDSQDRDAPAVIFTPFRKAVRWIRQAIEEDLPGTPVSEITGGLTDAVFTETWKAFQRGNGKEERNEKGFRVLICVIKSSASFHATCADTAFFLGCEYDFNQNAQAEDRIYRIGQTRPVNCHYLLYNNTVDDSVKRILNDKAFSADIVLSPDDVYKEMIARRK